MIISLNICLVFSVWIGFVENNDFCQLFVNNDNRIDYGFNSSDGQHFIVIGRDFWQIELRNNNKIIDLVSNDSINSRLCGRQYNLGFELERPVNISEPLDNLKKFVGLYRKSKKLIDWAIYNESKQELILEPESTEAVINFNPTIGFVLKSTNFNESKFVGLLEQRQINNDYIERDLRAFKLNYRYNSSEVKLEETLNTHYVNMFMAEINKISIAQNVKIVLIHTFTLESEVKYLVVLDNRQILEYCILEQCNEINQLIDCSDFTPNNNNKPVEVKLNQILFIVLILLTVLFVIGVLYDSFYRCCRRKSIKEVNEMPETDNYDTLSIFFRANKNC